MSGRGNGAALPLYRLGERRRAAPRSFAIGGVLPCGEAMVLIGAPKSGKSAVAVASAKAVCSGELFFGRRVRRGCVVYVPAERYNETELRLEVAFAGQDDELLRLSKARIYADEGDADRLAASILAMTEATGMPAVLVIFDTVAALLRSGAGDENSQRDIGSPTLSIRSVKRPVPPS